MKKSGRFNFILCFLLGAVILGSTAVFAAEPTNYAIARTKAWDGINHTLGGVPESVVKIEYAGSVFYLGKVVADAEFLAVLSAGSEAVKLKPPMENGKLYNYPIYILWNSNKTVLLVHPIIFYYDDILEAVAVPALPPASLTGSQAADAVQMVTEEYMLSAEYAEEVRKEFYRLLNEYRTANGLRALEVSLELQSYADVRADEQRQRFGHTRPDGSPAGSGWHNSQNYLNTRYAENAIGCGALSADPKDTANSIFTSWKNSKGHNRHMLYGFDLHIKMAFGIAPKLDGNGFITSGAIFATGY